MVLKKTLESPLDCKAIQPVNPKEISLEYSFEGLVLKLKLQYLGHLMPRAAEYSGCDIITWCDIIKNGRDVTCSSYNAIVHMVTQPQYV